MSGGAFDYNQYHVSDIADEIENIIKNNGAPSEYGSPIYPKDIIKKFEQGVKALRIASVYAQHIDRLVSGDDGEDSFREGLKDDIAELHKKQL